MNINYIKKTARIDKRIIYRKFKKKIIDRIIDKFYKLRDKNFSTYSLDYISFLEIDYSKTIELDKIFYFDYENYRDLKFIDNCLNHKFKVLSNELLSVNSNAEFNSIQSKFNKKLIPFSTKCFNKITNEYEQIDWQKDYNSDYRWEFNWFKNISYGNNSGHDIKVPWEIGRMQHLPILALEFNLSQSNAVLIEIRNQMFDFMASNPPNFGVQWICSMDIGIRLVNILFALLTLKGDNLFTIDEIELIDSFLYDHFSHIKENIEYSEGLRGNHYFSNLCSILIYLVYTKESDVRTSLIERYKSLLEKELDYQFNKDGSNFEGSSRYHLFTFQMLITVDIILMENGFEKLNQQKLQNISSFSSLLLEYGFVPQIGDNDSGFYWKLNNSEKFTYQSLIKIISNKYNYKKQDNFMNFGLLRRKTNDYDLIFKCGKLGQKGKGGHDHNDNLSYNLYCGMEPFVVDIGTYCYTSNFELRNKYRSTASHNVIWINDCEQNSFSSINNDDMFWLETNHQNSRIDSDKEKFISGTIDYCGKPYTREIELNSNIITVSDKYNSNIDKEINIYLFPNIKVEAVEKNVYKLFNEQNILFFETNAQKIKLENYEFSPAYGVKLGAVKIVLTSSENLIIHKYRDSIES